MDLHFLHLIIFRLVMSDSDDDVTIDQVGQQSPIRLPPKPKPAQITPKPMGFSCELCQKTQFASADDLNMHLMGVTHKIKKKLDQNNKMELNDMETKIADQEMIIKNQQNVLNQKDETIQEIKIRY